MENKISTLFLRGVDLVNKAVEKYDISSENWTYPFMKYGDPNFDNYYAEVWVNGMDYEIVYWLIEINKKDNGIVNVFPLLIIDNDLKVKFNDHDFKNLFKYLIYTRRNLLWIKHEVDTWKYEFEDVFPYLKETGLVYNKNKPYLAEFEFQHASQEKIKFYINKSVLQ